MNGGMFRIKFVLFFLLFSSFLLQSCMTFRRAEVRGSTGYFYKEELSTYTFVDTKAKNPLKACLNTDALRQYAVETSYEKSSAKTFLDNYFPNNASSKKSQIAEKMIVKYKSCEKVVFTDDVFRITFVIGKREGSDTILLRVAKVGFANKQSDNSHVSCMNRAKETSASLDLKWFDLFFSKYEVAHPGEISDPETGVVTYLNCDSEDGEFRESLSIMLHEMTHNMDQGDCVFSPLTNKKICFRGGRNLPGADKVKVFYPYTNTAFDLKTQKYIHNYYDENSFWHMVSELNAGSVSDTVLMRARGGIGNLTSGKRIRIDVVTSSMLYGVAAYFVRLHEVDKVRFFETFPYAKDRDQFVSWLEELESVVQQWQNAANKSGFIEVSGQLAYLWPAYLGQKKILVDLLKKNN